MNAISQKIIEARKLKGLSQEELAEESRISLRTLQRIENNKNNPREKTLSLICETLQIDLQDILIIQRNNGTSSLSVKLIDIFFIVIANLVLVAIVGYTTIDSNANFNSRFAGILLSILIPFFIVYFTQKMTATERLLKFGFGYLAYFIAALFFAGFIASFLSGLFICLILSLSVLYFGDQIIKKN